MKIDLLKVVKDGTAEDVEECTGLVFKGRTNTFLSSRGEYVYQERMLPLKRKSCRCGHCGYILDSLSDFIESGDAIPLAKPISDGTLYTLNITHESRDFESGIVDDFELEFSEIERFND